MYDKDLIGKKLTSKQYKKLMKRRRKEFNELCRNFNIWDWEYTHDLLVFIVEWMKDFYCENPDSFSDKKWIEERRCEFEDVLRLQKKYIEFDKLSNEAFLLATETIKTETKIMNKKYPAIRLEVRDNELEKKAIEYSKESDEAFSEFYKVLGSKIRNWWD